MRAQASVTAEAQRAITAARIFLTVGMAAYSGSCMRC